MTVLEIFSKINNNNLSRESRNSVLATENNTIPEVNKKTRKILVRLSIAMLALFTVMIFAIIAYTSIVDTTEKTISWKYTSTYDAPDGLILPEQRSESQLEIAFCYDITPKDKPYANEYHAELSYSLPIIGEVQSDLSENADTISDALGNTKNVTNGDAINAHYTKKIEMHLPEEARSTVEGN